MSHFLSLPPESIITILAHADDPRELYSMVRSSKYVYTCFKGYKAGILAAVVTRAYARGALIYEAVSACEASRIPQLWADNPTGSSQRLGEEQKSFLARYRNPRDSQTSDLRDLGLLYSLSKLWWIVDEFVSRFRTESFCHAVDQIPFLKSKFLSPITASEAARLQRALLRYEVFRKVFVESSPRVDKGSSPYESRSNPSLRKRFFQHFPPYEREEFLSIQEFLITYVHDLVVESLDYVLESLSVISERRKTRFKKDGIRIRSVGRERTKLFLESMFGHRFDQRNEFQRAVSHMAMRGLPFVRWFSDLAYNDRIYIYRKYVGRQWYTEVFQAIWWPVENLSVDEDIPREVPLDSRLQPLTASEGWRWARLHGITKSREDIRDRATLRRLGYVIWDPERVNDGWRLNITSPEMIIQDGPSEMSVATELSIDMQHAAMKGMKNLKFPEDVFEEDRVPLRLLFEPSPALDITPFPACFTEAERKHFGFEY